MREKFHKYLKNKGFNETGITECISRIERGVPDQIDDYQLRGFKEELRMENYELIAFIEELQKEKKTVLRLSEALECDIYDKLNPRTDI